MQKKNLQNNTPGTELFRCTNFDINTFVKDFEKLINLINNATVIQVVINFVITVKPSNTFQYLPIPNLQ